MDIRAKQRLVVEALEDVKGYDIVVFNTAKLPTMFERVVIASGTSNTQVKALADRVREKVNEAGGRVYGVEGEKGGEWVLVDLGEIVVHIMHPTVRSFYNLEEVWGGKSVKMKSPQKNPPKPAKRPSKLAKRSKPARRPSKPAKKSPSRGKAPRRRRSR
jgi:ribosome-associated protein